MTTINLFVANQHITTKEERSMASSDATDKVSPYDIMHKLNALKFGIMWLDQKITYGEELTSDDIMPLKLSLDDRMDELERYFKQ